MQTKLRDTFPCIAIYVWNLLLTPVNWVIGLREYSLHLELEEQTVSPLRPHTATARRAVIQDRAGRR